MTAPSFNVVHGKLVQVDGSTPEQMTRMEYLCRRAAALGHNAGVVESAERTVLTIGVRNLSGGSFGFINVWPATADEAERWHVSVSCDVMEGLPMQIDHLPAAAKVMREVFAALVLP